MRPPGPGARETGATSESPTRRGRFRGAAAWRIAGVGALLISHAALLAWSATRHSPTIDEVTWLPAGVRHWQIDTFDSAIVNPPLVRLLAAAPVMWLLPDDAPVVIDGMNFIRTYGPRSFLFFTVGRWACIPISLVGAYVCYR
jgi:hypothetical protein